MGLTSAIAIYFIIWWLVLFLVLPFGIRNAAEAGEEVAEGNDAGAPVTHGLVRKALVTTIISSGVFACVYLLLGTGLIENMGLPIFESFPKL